MKTVAEKMRIKPGVRAILVDAPEEAVASIKLPRIVRADELRGRFDYIHLFVKEQSSLKKKFPHLKSHLVPGGMLWVSWPKGGQLDSDLTIKNVIHTGYSFGLVESTCLRVNDVWSAIKFTHPKKGKTYNNSYGVLPEEQRV